MSVRVQAEPIEPGAELAAFTAASAGAGAVVSFTGLVRDEGGRLGALTLEHYPGMTEREIGRILEEARARWPLFGLSAVHRYGRLRPGEPIVFVAAAAAHRQDAFEAAGFVMDYLKTQAPFWKLEEGPDGSAWVEATARDDAAAARWRGRN